VRNGARYLVEAPGSLRGQSFFRYDLVVVDSRRSILPGSTGRKGSLPAI
jgi:hypothetical protein